MMLLGDKASIDSRNINILDNQQAQQISGEHSNRPKSTQDQISQRQHLDSANTGIAAKIAYNNLGKYVDIGDAHNSINSGKSSQSKNLRDSPSSGLDSRNTKNSFSNIERDNGNGIESMTEPSSQAVPIRSQRH